MAIQRLRIAKQSWERSWKLEVWYTPWLQIILQGYDNQNNMLLAQIRHILME